MDRLRAGEFTCLSTWGLVPSTKSMGDVLLAKLAALAEPKAKSVLVSLGRRPRISDVGVVWGISDVGIVCMENVNFTLGVGTVCVGWDRLSFLVRCSQVCSHLDSLRISYV